MQCQDRQSFSPCARANGFCGISQRCSVNIWFYFWSAPNSTAQQYSASCRSICDVHELRVTSLHLRWDMQHSAPDTDVRVRDSFSTTIGTSRANLKCAFGETKVSKSLTAWTNPTLYSNQNAVSSPKRPISKRIGENAGIYRRFEPMIVGLKNGLRFLFKSRTIIELTDIR
jgi:hypothetical protein